MTHKLVNAVVAGLAALLYAGCSDSSSPSDDLSAGPSCTAGESASCRGADGCAGARVCNASGRFDTCVCGSLPPSDGGTDATVEGPPGAPLGVAAVPVPVVATVSTLAGSGVEAFADGTGAAASFVSPQGLTIDGAGSLYVADKTRLRKVTSAGLVTTLAGSGAAGFADGTGTAASFNELTSAAVDGSGNVFAADTANNRVRKVTPAGVVTTFAGSGTAAFADGTGAGASFNYPGGVALDKAGNIFVNDSLNRRVRKITPMGLVTTLAGSDTYGSTDGTGSAASFMYLRGLTVNVDGDIFVADSSANRIRKVTALGAVTTFAGSGASAFADGTAAAASFQFPNAVAADANGNVYVADSANFRIRRVTATGAVTTLAGSGTPAFADGVGVAASFDTPRGICVDAAGNVYVGDTSNRRIRKIATVGIGELVVSWKEPASPGTSVIKGYSASANAPGQPMRSCTTTSATTCTLTGLVSGVPYSISVVASNTAGAGPAAAIASGAAN